MKNLLIFIPIIILFFSCNSNNKEPINDKLTFTNDCESSDGWENISRAFSTENFHSGRYSNKLNPQNPYSLTFRYKYGDLSKKQIKSVVVSVWAYFLTNKFEGKSFVVVVDSSDQKLIWAGIDMKEFVKSPRTWTKIEKEICFPRKYEPNSIFSIYAWNNSEDAILVDDFRIQFVEK